MKRLLAWLGGVTAVALAISASAQEAEDNGAVSHPQDWVKTRTHSVIHPSFEMLSRQVERFGRFAPVFGASGLPETTRLNGAGATLHFQRNLSARERAVAASLGVELRSVMRTSAGPIYSAWVPFDAFERLRTTTPLNRAEPSWAPVMLVPLELTTEMTGASQLGRGSVQPRGQGVLAHIDSGVDVQHPHLFRADGGYFFWIDVNQNRRFDPQTDAIDYDHDGEASSNETAGLLEGAELETFDGDVSGLDGALDPARDWVYVDFNADGVRNYGVEAGFTEEDPGFGEPMFVADDANGDGQIDLTEKFVLLSTSKVVRVVEDDVVYERGQNLIDALKGDSHPFSFHGTGVASIAVGGQRGFHDRVGVAPGADVEIYAFGGGFETGFFDSSLQLQYLNYLQGRDVVSVLHEWTNPFTVAQDGSTNLEQAMDALGQAGKVQVTPVGNLGLADKHIEMDIGVGDPVVFGFDVGEGFVRGGQSLPYETAYLSLFWRQDQDLEIRLEDPSGSILTISPGTSQVLGSAELESSLDRTPRGTQHLLVVLYHPDDVLEAGEWRIHVDSVSLTDVLVGRVTDEHSGWAPGIHWLEPTLSGTFAHPSTADSAVGVAAYAGRNGSSDQLRDFSGRGLRSDGRRVVDIAAPDDPFVALAVTSELLDAGVGSSWFTRFGGTSGAAPHVSAAFALLDPDVQDPVERLLTSANPDVIQSDVPHADWGWGQLDVHRAVTGQSYEWVENLPPEAVLEVFSDGDDFVLDASESSDPEGEALEFRFDVDYDGSPDTEWGTAPTFPTTEFSPTSRVWVRDALGATHGATARWPVVEFLDEGNDLRPPTDEPPGCEGCATSVSSDGLFWWVLVLAVGMRRRLKS